MRWLWMTMVHKPSFLIQIARSTMHPTLSKIKNHYWKTSKIEKKNNLSIIGDFFSAKNIFYFENWIFLMNFDAFLMVFDVTQFWLDGPPGNEYFWIPHKISGLMTPVHLQWFETDLSHSSYSDFIKLASASKIIYPKY